MSYDRWKLRSPEDEADENERRWRDPRRDFYDQADALYQRCLDGDRGGRGREGGRLMQRYSLRQGKDAIQLVPLADFAQQAQGEESQNPGDPT